VFAARSSLCTGLAVCFGSSTVTPGSVEFGVVCDIAAPVRLHSNATDSITTAATRLDDILITRSPKSGHHTSTAIADVLIAFGSIAQRPHFDELLPGQLPPCEQAAAIPPGVTVSPTQKLSSVLAFIIGFVVAYVSACCRETKFSPRNGAAIPGLVAVLET
jgi:hypothetical protein